MRRLLILLALMVAIISTGVANAVVVVSYGPFDARFYQVADGADQNWSAQHMADVGASIAAWDNRILNTAGRQITLDLYWVNFPGNILGGSSSPSYGDGTTSWNYGEHVWRDGVNYDGQWDGYDTIIQLDIDAAGFDWNFSSGAVGATDIDFRSVMTHEIGHSLGFSATYDPNPIFDD